MKLFFTVCNKTQLKEAVALGQSVLKHHSNEKFVLCWADKADPPVLPPSFDLVRVEAIGLDDLQAMSDRYYDFEMAPATRPWFALHLFRTYGNISHLIFLSPTAYLLGPMTRLLTDGPPLYLTPHITAPLPSSRYLDDKRILNIGMFHAGAWIARPVPEVFRFMEWWATRTTDRAHFDLCNGMCMDQLWLNYAPVSVPGAQPVRDRGWHLGLHNLPERLLRKEAGLITCDGVPLISVDFAGVHSYHPVWSDHTGLLKSCRVWNEIDGYYREALKECTVFSVSGEAIYGKKAGISPYRSLRRKAANRLKDLSRMIAEIDIKR